VHAGAVLAVGDSVTLDIAAALQRDVPGTTVDGKVGRQFGDGVVIVNQLRRAGRLPPTVVVALGTNGTVTTPQFDAMMQAAAGASRVVFVTVRVPRTWQDEVNSVLRAGVARYANTALADWYALSAGHAAWLAPDGYHLTPAGAAALAQLIASAIAQGR
jgi:lysophospholipase L1-like esterase